MKFVPSLPPLGPPAAIDRMPVSGVAAIKPTRPVQPRTLIPLVTPQHDPNEPLRGDEYRHDPLLHGDRRTYCRRCLHIPVLVDLRSGIERRHNNRREGDPTEHIDLSV